MDSTPSPLAKPGFVPPQARPRSDLGLWRRSGSGSRQALAMEASEEIGHTRLRLTGALTARTAVSFKAAVAPLCERSTVLLIDLQDVPHLDPTGLAALAEATEIGSRHACRVVIAHVPASARRWIAQASLHKVIELGE